jgi:anti-sigma factor RsiW
MNCEEATALLAADVDGEVDGLRSHAVRKHAAGCETCRPRLDGLLELQRQLRCEIPYHAAPATLRARLVAEASVAEPHQDRAVPMSARTSTPMPAPDRRWRWFGGGLLTGGLAAAALLWGLGMPASLHDFGDDLATRVVGLHTRASLGNRLIEVASSDSHTVKPWLSARLDYAIPVTDWAAAGFPLVGARIDRLDGRAVATLVYRHRAHVIDVFVRPQAQGLAPEPMHTVRGFHVAAAQGAQMQWVATSDLNADVLAVFVQGLARGQVELTSE